MPPAVPRVTRYQHLKKQGRIWYAGKGAADQDALMDGMTKAEKRPFPGRSENAWAGDLPARGI